MLALVMASKKLNHYFQAHKIVVLTEHPLKSLLQLRDLTEWIARWAVAMGQYDLEFRPRTAIKGQVLADFVAEFTSETIEHRAPLSKDEHCPSKQRESQPKSKEQKSKRRNNSDPTTSTSATHSDCLSMEVQTDKEQWQEYC